MSEARSSKLKMVQKHKSPSSNAARGLGSCVLSAYGADLTVRHSLPEIGRRLDALGVASEDLVLDSLANCAKADACPHRTGDSVGVVALHARTGLHCCRVLLAGDALIVAGSPRSPSFWDGSGLGPCRRRDP